MVKSLLLGSAAGLVAVTAGQAADLPVKAKPVEYVKICSLYGAGFYYMPGTDMCIKIGGWVRAEATDGNINTSMTWGPFAGQENTRLTSNFVSRARGYITADAREQTAYGTARAYIDVGYNSSDLGTSASESTNAFSSNRVFLQWAGFTAGLTQSFYDFYSGPAAAYRAGYLPASDTGDAGWWLWAYTAQLGNGVSATISAEQRRMSQIIGVNSSGAPASPGIVNGALLTAGTITALGYGGMQSPDIVANLRVDQTWGSAQIMGALHEDNGQWYGSTGVLAATGLGHPSDAWGWVVGAGLRLNFPMVAQGDYFQSQVNYTQGALKYIDNSETTNFETLYGNSQGYGIQSDCVYGATGGGAVGVTATGGTSCQLTTAWNVNASYEHYWTPSVHQSFVGDYEAVTYNSQANGILCNAEGTSGAGAVANGSAAFVAASGCNNNWSMWGVSSRLQWDVTKTFYLGVEVLYDDLNSATSVNGLLPSNVSLGAPGPGATAVSVGNQTAWAATVRMHKDFLP
jgi:hypothetical protein